MNALRLELKAKEGIYIMRIRKLIPMITIAMALTTSIAFAQAKREQRSLCQQCQDSVPPCDRMCMQRWANRGFGSYRECWLQVCMQQYAACKANCRP